jgi:hypothetical protein
MISHGSSLSPTHLHGRSGKKGRWIRTHLLDEAIEPSCSISGYTHCWAPNPLLRHESHVGRPPSQRILRSRHSRQASERALHERPERREPAAEGDEAPDVFDLDGIAAADGRGEWEAVEVLLEGAIAIRAANYLVVKSGWEWGGKGNGASAH